MWKVGWTLFLLTIDPKKWQKDAPYVDTVCLPLYANPFFDEQLGLECARAIEQIAYQVERKVTGRLLLIPAICYSSEDLSVFQPYLEQVIHSFQQTGFHYAITIADQPIAVVKQEKIEHFHFQIENKPYTQEEIELWRRNVFNRFSIYG